MSLTPHPSKIKDFCHLLLKEKALEGEHPPGQGVCRGGVHLSRKSVSRRGGSPTLPNLPTRTMAKWGTREGQDPPLRWGLKI